MAITRVRIPARWNDGGGLKIGVADFTLGLGSCGKVVKMLDASVTADYVIVTQATDDGEVKSFYYRQRDICGRVEITRKNV